MGATNFTVTAEGATVAEAFRTAREAALWEHGHGGYTGSIAEKDDYRVFRLPAGLAARDAVRMLAAYGWDQAKDAETEKVWQSIAEAQETYDDKWGPAVALQVSPTEWAFCGMASE